MASLDFQSRYNELFGAEENIFSSSPTLRDVVPGLVPGTSSRYQSKELNQRRQAVQSRKSRTGTIRSMDTPTNSIDNTPPVVTQYPQPPPEIGDVGLPPVIDTPGGDPTGPAYPPIQSELGGGDINEPAPMPTPEELGTVIPMPPPVDDINTPVSGGTTIPPFQVQDVSNPGPGGPGANPGGGEGGQGGFGGTDDGMGDDGPAGGELGTSIGNSIAGVMGQAGMQGAIGTGIAGIAAGAPIGAIGNAVAGNAVSAAFGLANPALAVAMANSIGGSIASGIMGSNAAESMGLSASGQGAIAASDAVSSGFGLAGMAASSLGHSIGTSLGFDMGTSPTTDAMAAATASSEGLAAGMHSTASTASSIADASAAAVAAANSNPATASTGLSIAQASVAAQASQTGSGIGGGSPGNAGTSSGSGGTSGAIGNSGLGPSALGESGGLGGGGGGGGCVVGTEMTAQSMWRRRDLAETERWCQNTLHDTILGESMRRGYRWYGRKGVKLMRKSKVFAKIAGWLFRKFSDDRTGKQHSIVGKVIYGMFGAVAGIIGMFSRRS